MALPYELLQYAENFYRRFPEEFMALGAPGLEDTYDLRPNSTLTRRMQDTPTEKSVEITLRRWQMPPMGGGMPQSWGYPQAHSAFGPPPHHLSAVGVMQQQAAGLSTSSTAAGHYGHPSYNGYHGMPASGPPPHAAAPPQAPPQWEAELTSRLSRLEGALSSLKPQIEGLLRNPQPPVHPSKAPQQRSAALFPGSSDDATVHPSSKQPSSPPTSKTSLANRRGAASLAIQTLPGAQTTQAAEKPTSTEPAVKPMAVVTKQVQDSSSSPTNKAELASGDSKDRGRPAVSINPCRVAPGLLDPQSPRSPGRYTAWK